MIIFTNNVFSSVNFRSFLKMGIQGNGWYYFAWDFKRLSWVAALTLLLLCQGQCQCQLEDSEVAHSYKG